jgi:hypothetical protein
VHDGYEKGTLMNEEDMRDLIRRLQYKCDQLERTNLSLYTRLDAAESRIRNDLEPRIAVEERGYDQWATSPERS